MTLPASWRDGADQAVIRPAVPSPDEPAFYQPIGAFQGSTYERNAFAQHTAHEVAWLWDALVLTEQMRLVDVGCGTGRHARMLAAKGVTTVGIDVSAELLAAGAAQADDLPVTFHQGDAATILTTVCEPQAFDRAVSLHQGALGISPVGDDAVLAGLARVLKPGGMLAATFFHALFAARHLVGEDAYDPINGVHHQRAEVYGPDATRQTFDLWTTAYTVRDAVRACEKHGFHVSDVRGIEPGAFSKREAFTVGLNDPEFVVIATR